MGELDPEKLAEQLRAAIPPQHREFAAKLLADHGIPEIPPEERHHELLGREANGSEHPEATGIRDRSHHVTAMGKGKNRKLDPESSTEIGLHENSSSHRLGKSGAGD
jgi:hypothetical protein